MAACRTVLPTPQMNEASRNSPRLSVRADGTKSRNPAAKITNESAMVRRYPIRRMICAVG